MTSKFGPFARFPLSLACALLAVLLGVLWLAGGASQAGVLGQVVVRAAAWIALILFLLLGQRVSRFEWPILLLALATLALAILQLVPLPPSMWQALPGRMPLLEAAAASGQDQPWRPWSIVPDATLNAASSLIVPFAVLFLMTGLRENERALLPGILLTLIALSSLVGLLQFSGVPLDNPLTNDLKGNVAGTFANRNHFALFVALGCVIAPIWAFQLGNSREWRAPLACGLMLLFTLTILASGSRAGMMAGGLAIVIGLISARSGIRRMLARYPRWLTWSLIGGVLVSIGVAVLLSVAMGRAISIDRTFTVDQGQDMRVRGLSTVLTMIREYFPFGSGLGGFDPMFRMHEPFDLLKPTCFNHAHNDWLEIVLDTGLPGLLLLLVAAGWWAWASVRAWRARSGRDGAMPRLGSAMLLLILLASIFDYPARTPMMMAIVVIAGVWLSAWVETPASPALRAPKQHL